MARYTGPKCRQCRREGTKLYLKGARCLSEKCAVTKRNTPPGQKHLRVRRGHSDYGRHLREKQKVKRIYGLLETQFRRYYEDAARVHGVTGQVLLTMLESRLDSVVYASGFSSSRAEGRQKIRQGKVMVNGKDVNIPSYQVKAGDIITFSGIESSPRTDEEMPVWLLWDKTQKGVKINSLPSRDDVKHEVNEQLIVEYYSR